MGSGDDDFGFRVMGLGSNYGIDTSIASEPSSSSSVPIDSSNIGFKLLKKHGWKEGTGLGVAEQGRLEPVEAHMKTNKRGLGAEKVKKAKGKSKDPENPMDQDSEKVIFLAF
ncbi:OLC1v1033365C2 [Oldenlandia corymbosa var. corymbosa]|uniref:OLC1v1033365C2 n=1 Tax=Oldenlandia corymbosa var. corymbosa TaxID=529605 RepID=A0AAV1CPV9_OLDCO|nr:OLC1v1033365C2 [Oldenlandia corymbosa var. corymbosa]